MIFLGAGASKPYGIPTLKEFSEYALQILKKLGHEQIIQSIEDSLNEFDMIMDFEATGMDKLLDKRLGKLPIETERWILSNHDCNIEPIRRSDLNKALEDFKKKGGKQLNDRITRNR